MSQTKPRNSHLTRQMLEDELERAHIRRVNVTADMVMLYLEDGRVVGMPTVWSPRLSDADEAERQNYEIIGHGAGLHWPDLDEYVSVRSMLLGRRSPERNGDNAKTESASEKNTIPENLPPRTRQMVESPAPATTTRDLDNDIEAWVNAMHAKHK